MPAHKAADGIGGVDERLQLPEGRKCLCRNDLQRIVSRSTFSRNEANGVA